MAVKPPDLRNRAPKVEILPDKRQRVTRVYDILDEVPKNQTGGTIQPGLSNYLLPWGTADSVPASEGSSYPNCLLVKQNVEGQFEINGTSLDKPTEKKPTLTRVYEQIPATTEVQVGENDTTVDQDNLTTVVQHFLQFSTVAGGGQTFEVIGTANTTAANGIVCILKEEKRTDDGTLQRIERTYISRGQISEKWDYKFNGALTLITAVYVNPLTVPVTPPSNFTEVSVDEQHINGVPIFTYVWASGAGVISTQVEFRLSPDQGTTGVTVTTIKALSFPGGSNPITGPGGAEEIALTYEESDGYRMWTEIFASGQGVISTEITRRFNDNLQLTTITSINTAPSAPSPALGGTVVLVKTEKRNGTRFEDGTIIYTYTWAEGYGIGGLVTRAEPDGALLYEQTVLTATLLSASTFASDYPFPGSGTGYLIDLDQKQDDGYTLNRATWKKPPATAALRRTMKFKYPGTINILSAPYGYQLIPPVDMDILATDTVSYGTSQVTTTPFGISGYASVASEWVATNQNAPKQTQAEQKALAGYLSDGTSASNTASVFNGIPCDSWSYTIQASTPGTGPSGPTTLEVRNDIYLMDVFGNIVYRSRVTSYSF